MFTVEIYTDNFDGSMDFDNFDDALAWAQKIQSNVMASTHGNRFLGYTIIEK